MTGRQHGSLLLLAIATCHPGRAGAQEEPPHIEFDATVFSGRNPFLTGDDNAMTSAGEVSAQGGAKLALGHRTTIDLDGRIAYRRYDRRYGSFVTGHAMAAIDHRLDEHLSLRTEARYERFLPLEGLAASIDAAIDPVSLQERYEARQEVVWRPDPFLTLRGTVSWMKLAPRGSLLLARTEGTSLGLAAERRISTTSWIGAEGRATVSQSSDGVDADAGALVAKAGTRFAAHWTLEGEAGAARISRRDPGLPREDGPARLTAAASLCYDPRRLRICATARVAPVLTTFGGIRRERSAHLAFDFQTSERGTLSAEADYRSVPRPGFGSDASVLRLSSAYEHRLDSRFRLHVGADYDRRSGVTRQTQDTWTVRVGVTFRIPSP
ncbi:hypothetical protein [Novosphingobium resinovorum]|uniref:hypothetical protein n=1 Tax=Novosphingobium resinovorum TaxID=158500 RepID=UPI002ED4C14D|nr:hypothetical protein [Novosphingobium resinovorum]